MARPSFLVSQLMGNCHISIYIHLLCIPIPLQNIYAHFKNPQTMKIYAYTIYIQSHSFIANLYTSEHIHISLILIRTREVDLLRLHMHLYTTHLTILSIVIASVYKLKAFIYHIHHIYLHIYIYIYIYILSSPRKLPGSFSQFFRITLFASGKLENLNN